MARPHFCLHDPGDVQYPAEIDQLTERIIGCAIEVHKTLGAGLLESVYRECLIIELTNAGLRFESERHIRLTYKGVSINSKLRLDLLIEGTVVVELKAIEVNFVPFISRKS